MTGVFLKDPNKLIFSIFPNPFITSTTMEYYLNVPQTIHIIGYDHQGKVVDRIKLSQPAGYNSALWNSENLAPGIYYLQLVSKEQIACKQVMKIY